VLELKTSKQTEKTQTETELHVTFTSSICNLISTKQGFCSELVWILNKQLKS